jgi:hypothetical protein
MQSQPWEPYIGCPVEASHAISFAGGDSPWLGAKGVVKKLLTARACMVQLEGELDHLMFFVRELTPLEP